MVTVPTDFKQKLGLLAARLDAITATLLADIYEAMAALQDILVVPGIAHLAPEAPARRTPIDALEATRVLTFVIILQLREDLVEPRKPLVRKDVRRCVSIHDLVGSLFDAIDVCWSACAVLPLHTTYVAELCATYATSCC
jgi:hypothetical protein